MNGGARPTSEEQLQERIASIKEMNAACVPPLIVSDAFVEAMARGIVMHFPLSEEIKRAEQQLNHTDPLMVTAARNRIVRAAEHVADLELQLRIARGDA